MRSFAFRAAFVALVLFPIASGSAEVFSDNFEDGDLTDWDVAGQSGISASDVAAQGGSDYGMRVDASNGVSANVRARRVVSPAAQGESFRIAFDVRFASAPFSLSGAGQIEIPIATAELALPDAQPELTLRAVDIDDDPTGAPDLRWRLVIRQDNGASIVRSVSTASPPIVPGSWHHVEIVHVASSDPEAEEGEGLVQLFIDHDPNPAIEERAVLNAAQTELSEVRLGVPGAVQTGTFYGIIDFDNVDVDSLFGWSDGFEPDTSEWSSTAGVSVVDDPIMGNALQVDAQGLTGQTARVEQNFVAESFGDELLFEFDFFSSGDLSFPASGSAIPSVGIFSAELAGEEGLPDLVLRIYNINPNGPQDLRWGLRALEDDGTARETPRDSTAPPVELGTWLHLRLTYTPSEPGLSNGVVRLFVDDQPFPILELTGLDTDAQTTLDEARLGVSEVPQNGSLTGQLRFDAFSTRALPLAIPVPSDTVLVGDGLLYRVTLWENFNAASNSLPNQVVIEGGALGVTNHPEATVTVSSVLQPDGSTEWGIQVVPNGSFGVYRVEFPLLVANPIRGLGDEQLIVPEGIGRSITDPLGAEETLRPAQHIPINKRSVWYATYGSKDQTLPLMAYEKNGRGILLYTKDPNLNLKDFEFSGDTEPSYYGPGRRIAVHHYPANTGAPGVGWTNPYPVVTREYTSGWYEAVQTHYRPWALQQKWADAGSIMARLRTGELPGWYVNNAVWASGISTIELPILQSIRDRLQAVVASSASSPDPEIGVFQTGWHNDPFNNVLPRFFPPDAHTAQTQCPACWYFQYLELQDSGLRVSPYFNIHVAQTLNGQLVTPVLPFEDPANQPATASILATELTGLLAPNSYREVGGKFLPFCRGASAWRAYFRELSARSLQSHEPDAFDAEFGQYGTDSQYYDQVSPGSVYPCFATDHGHMPGFGDFIHEGTRGLAADAVADAGPRIIVGEGNFEGNVESIHESYATEPAWWTARDPQTQRLPIVPLFPAVYHGYTSLHEWPNHLTDYESPVSPDLDAFASALAMPAHLGHKVGGFNTTTTWKTLFGFDDSGCRPESEAACQILDDLVVVTSRTMDAWAYGERLADPTATRTDGGAAEGTATWCGDTKGGPCVFNPPDNPLGPITVRRPIVQASLWRSLVDAQRKALVLSNWSGQAAMVSLAADLAPGTQLFDVQGGSNLVYNPGVQVTLGPRDWLVYVTEQVPNPDGDFVPQAVDNCPTTHNPDQRDSNDDGVGDACSTSELVPDALSIGTEDGSIREQQQTIHKGKDLLTAGTCDAGLPVGDDLANKQVMGILSFDTSALPDTADVVILGARLTLHRNDLPTEGDPSDLGDLQIEVLDGAFSGSTALQKQDFEDPAGVAGGVLTAGATIHFGDLNAAALAEISTTGRTQIRLSMTLEDDGDGVRDQWLFCPGDVADLQPRLKIRYTE
jgi:hypothetical protein